MSREKTREECRDEFLDYIRALVKQCRKSRYDDDTKADQPDEITYRLELLAFSILVAIDGESPLPAFILAPCSHPDDKAFRQKEDENWYPENDESKVKCDIGGDLHDNFYQRKDCAPIT